METVKIDNVAIDGPAGTGKSTVSKLLAKKLGFHMFDTGATYRAVTYGCLLDKIGLEDEGKCAEVAKKVKVLIDDKTGLQTVYYNEQDCTPFIRSPDVSKVVPIVSAMPKVREIMVSLQRSLSASGRFVAEGLNFIFNYFFKLLLNFLPVFVILLYVCMYMYILLGRDIGTVVFPNARWKFFLTASSRVRAERRVLQLKEQNIIKEELTEDTLKDIQSQIEERDKVDSTREVSPLRKADDAILLETDKMTIEEVVDWLYKSITKELK